MPFPQKLTEEACHYKRLRDVAHVGVRNAEAQGKHFPTVALWNLSKFSIMAVIDNFQNSITFIF